MSLAIFIVYGNLEMQNSGVNVQPGQNVWLDSQAVGQWGNGTASSRGTLDANGFRGTANCSSYAAWPLNSANEMALICYVGSPSAPTQMGQPPLLYDYAGGTFDGNPQCFLVGNTLLNYQIPGSGNLNFMCNYGGISTNGSGKQIERIIVTQ